MPSRKEAAAGGCGARLRRGAVFFLAALPIPERLPVRPLLFTIFSLLTLFAVFAIATLFATLLLLAFLAHYGLILLLLNKLVTTLLFRVVTHGSGTHSHSCSLSAGAEWDDCAPAAKLPAAGGLSRRRRTSLLPHLHLALFRLHSRARTPKTPVPAAVYACLVSRRISMGEHAHHRTYRCKREIDHKNKTCSLRQQ